jgi:hypothetical protein
VDARDKPGHDDSGLLVTARFVHRAWNIKGLRYRFVSRPCPGTAAQKFGRSEDINSLRAAEIWIPNLFQNFIWGGIGRDMKHQRVKPEKIWNRAILNLEDLRPSP